MLQQELKHQKLLKERQETFDEVFKGELESYKATGVVPSNLIIFLLYLFINYLMFIYFMLF